LQKLALCDVILGCFGFRVVLIDDDLEILTTDSTQQWNMRSNSQAKLKGQNNMESQFADLIQGVMKS